jgi:hypothetical protein
MAQSSQRFEPPQNTGRFILSAAAESEDSFIDHAQVELRKALGFYKNQQCCTS